jgi:NAD-dependent DNA ligase
MQFVNDIEKYIISRWMYSVAEPVITDAEYNALHRYMQESKECLEYSNRTWSDDPCPTDLLNKYGLEDKIYSIQLLDKTESIPSLTTELEIAQFYKGMVGLHLISYKMDGFNLQLVYFNGKLVSINTRGRAVNGIMDVSYLNTLFPESITLLGEVKVIGELLLSDSAFKKIREMYPEKQLVSQRSAVKTAMVNAEARELLSFFTFDIKTEDKQLPCSYTFYLLQSWGFKIPNYSIANTYEELQVATKAMSDAVKAFPYPTDGLVVRSDEGRSLRALRVHHWEEEIYYSYVTGFEEDFGPLRTGVKALIYNIRLKNSTQTKVNITNFATAVDNNLFVGTPIAFKLISSAIADIDLNVTKLLQRQWAGKYSSYRGRVEVEEYLKAERE